MATHGYVDVFWKAMKPLFNLGSFVLPLGVGVSAFSILEEFFSGLINASISLALLTISFMVETLQVASYKVIIVFFRVTLDYKKHILSSEHPVNGQQRN